MERKKGEIMKLSEICITQVRDFGNFKTEIKVYPLKRRVTITDYWLDKKENAYYCIPERDRKVIRFGILTFLKFLLFREYRKPEFLFRSLFLV